MGYVVADARKLESHRIQQCEFDGSKDKNWTGATGQLWLLHRQW